MSGVTLDAGGLIALDRNDRRVIALLARASEVGAPVTIPATALAQAVRRPSKQARLSRLVRQPTARVVPLDGLDATRVGVLLATRGAEDITDAHVVVCARRYGEAIVTSDPADLRRLDPQAVLIVV
jgi:predicted nucleic acid-binding protein